MSRHRDEGTGGDIALVIAWSIEQPERVGELAFFGQHAPPRILGRGEQAEQDELPRVQFFRQRPGQLIPTGSIRGPRISRRQLAMEPTADGVQVRNIGRCAMLVNDKLVTDAVVRPGDVLLLEQQLVLFCTRRAPQMPHLVYYPEGWEGPFGGPDNHGLVGESPAVWGLRDATSRCALDEGHVLVVGGTGTGKGLVAQAIHSMSAEGGVPVRAQASELTVDKLSKLLRMASGGVDGQRGHRAMTLFIDEMCNLQPDVQRQLLRLLQAEQDPTAGRARRLRVIGASSRGARALDPRLLDGLPLRIQVPSLHRHREDIPLLVNLILCVAARKNAELAARYFDGWDGTWGVPRLGPDLVAALLRHEYSADFYELQRLVARATAGSTFNYVELTDDVRPKLVFPAPGHVDPSELRPDEIQACLDRNRGDHARTWRELGLRSRSVLYRLIKKYDLDTGSGRYQRIHALTPSSR